MQGTVATFDEPGTTGRCCSTTARRWRFRRRAFAASGLRLLRLGQRVRVELDADGEVRRVTLPTLP